MSICIEIDSALNYYRPQRSWAKVISSQASVCPQGGSGGLVLGGGGSGRGRGLVLGGGCVVCLGGWWSVQGGLQFFGKLQFFWGGSNFLGGLQFFWGGLIQIFFYSNFFNSNFFSNFFSPNFFWDAPPTPHPQIRSLSGRYASYWNAFLFLIYFH